VSSWSSAQLHLDGWELLLAGLGLAASGCVGVVGVHSGQTLPHQQHHHYHQAVTAQCAWEGGGSKEENNTFVLWSKNTTL
jgi:hypothetical protein